MTQSTDLFNDLAKLSNTTAATIASIGVDISSKITAAAWENPVDCLERRVRELEEIVRLLSRNQNLEAKYPKLREIGDAYTAELKKYKTWETLNDKGSV